MIFLGIDPGLSGALAFYNKDDHSLALHDMPVVEMVRNGKAKREVSPHLISEIIGGCPTQSAKAFVERVSAMPGQGVTSVFSFGRSSGIIEGALAALGVSYTLVTPQAWMKATGIRAGKDGSRQRAMELFPNYADLFARKKDDGRSDAALIAYYGASQ